MMKQCWCCDLRFPARDSATDEWQGRMDDYCLDCALARCDWIAGGCGKTKYVGDPHQPVNVGR